MNADSFFGPVSVIAILLAFFFVAMAYLRHLGAKRARTRKRSKDEKPWQISNPYTASENLTAPPPLATLAPPPAARNVASDPTSPVFRQFSSTSPSAAKPAPPAPGYVWE
ncbi:MAG: hypothetical protein EOM72_05660 [Opitutae bacterium]|nr:hypothetical protein [Opitutae bacterium]